MMDSLWRIFSFLIRPLKNLNKDPVLFSFKYGYFVKFGLFSAIASVVGVFLLLFFLSLKDIPIPCNLYLWFICAAILIWFSSRLAYLFSLGKKFFKNPGDYLFDTGLYGQGGILGALLFFIFLAWHLSVPIFLFTDALAYGGAIALAIGRIGCYTYGCCWGRKTHADFGIIYNNPLAKVLRCKPYLKGKNLYPVQLMTSFLDIVLFLLLNVLLFLNVYNGIISSFFIIVKPSLRLWLERYRDDEVIGEKRNWTTVFLASFMVALGFLIILINLPFWISQPPQKIITFHSYWTHLIFAFSNFCIWLCSLIFGLVIGILNGVHGKKIGSWT